MRYRAAVVIAIALLAAQHASAAPPASPVKATLLADVSAFKPGDPFTLGVLLEIEPEWHVYWTNPGDSGFAPTVKFTLPPGFSATPLAFPIPTRFNQPDNAVGYGYHDRVLLTARVTTPKDLPAGRNVEIGAAVSWLCCKDACIPGKAKTTLALNLSDGPLAANSELFKTWVAMIPVPLDRSQDIAKVDSALDPKTHTATLTVHWKHVPAEVQLFPGADDAIAVKEITPKTAGQTTTITMNVQTLPGQTPAAAELPAVIAFTDANGHRKGVEVKVPLKS
ncbi:MAG: hypothetical protein JWM97_1211 [Phycisphaerales bacterium]|nr:hypothetical protein [Phycisphaerales bacterium]MDB5303662.1 hypothetical protein [Phycisphaerales bacterium]